MLNLVQNLKLSRDVFQIKDKNRLCMQNGEVQIILQNLPLNRLLTMCPISFLEI